MKNLKRLYKKIIYAMVIMAIGSVVLISMGVSELLSLKETNGGLNLNEMQENEFKENTYIKGNINFCFGQFAEEDTIDTSGVEHYYILPLTQFGYDFDDFKYIAIVSTNDEDIQEIERLTDDTFNYMYSETASDPAPIENYQGKLTDMDDDVKKLMVEYFREAELYKNDAEIEQHILPYTLQYSTIKDAYIDLGVGIGLGAVVIIIISIVVIIYFKTKKRNEESRYRENGYQYQKEEQYTGPEIK